MRVDPLQARSFLIVETAAIGYVVALGTVAFARFWGLVVHDEWVVPLMLIMGIQFLLELALAAKTNTFNWPAVASVLLTKVVLILTAAMGFTVQRMALPDDKGVTIAWGHITVGCIIAWEVIRGLNIVRHFDVPMGVFGALLSWAETALRSPTTQIRTRQVVQRAVVAERRAAREEYFDTGAPNSHAAIDVMSGEDIPQIDDSDTVPSEDTP